MIILEGPDCAGKSSLAKVVFNDWHYKHQGVYKTDPMVETIIQSDVCMDATVWDRLHLGEQVYGPVYRGDDKLGMACLRMTERYLLRKRSVVIRCLPPWENVRAEFEQRLNEEMFGRGDDWQLKLRGQYSGYERLKTHLRMWDWDYTTDDPVKLRDQVLAGLPEHDSGPGVGDFTRGGILIIGEQPNIARTHAFAKMDLPFIDRQGCSRWLAEHMDEAGLPERGLYWINALQRNGKTTDEAFLDQLEPKHVFALGQKARLWAQIAGLQPHYYQHPSAWMRFHGAEEYPFITHLQEVTRGSDPQ